MFESATLAKAAVALLEEFANDHFKPLFVEKITSKFLNI